MPSLAKHTIIKSLEDLVIKLGYDSNDVKAAEEMIKNKNADIQALRKQLKLHTTKHPQAKQVGQLEIEKNNMFKMIIEQNPY